VLICGLLIGLSPKLIPLFFGSDFSPAIYAAMLMVIAGGTAGLRRVISDALRGLGKPSAILVGELVGITLTSISFLFLSPSTVAGAAVAVLVGETIAMVSLLVLVKRAVNRGISYLLVPTVDDISTVLELFRKT
jgi:O-antigen/teichoic acid export membrane protein